jgi:hypothetical protein
MEDLQLISTIGPIPYETIEVSTLVIYEQYIDEDKIKSYKHTIERNEEEVDEYEYINTFDSLQDAETYIENNLI